LPKDMSPWEAKYDMNMPRYTGTSCQWTFEKYNLSYLNAENKI
jgi:hypothetical protein